MNALFVGLALAVAAPGLKDPPRGEPPPIEGDWELVEWLNGGSAAALQPGMGGEFLPGGKRVWRDGIGLTSERGYKLIAKTSPPAIDLIRPAAGQEPDVFHAIYKIDGDTLILAIGDLGGDRPKTIEAGKEGDRMLMTFRRIKKK